MHLSKAEGLCRLNRLHFQLLQIRFCTLQDQAQYLHVKLFT